MGHDRDADRLIHQHIHQGEHHHHIPCGFCGALGIPLYRAPDIEELRDAVLCGACMLLFRVGKIYESTIRIESTQQEILARLPHAPNLGHTTIHLVEVGPKPQENHMASDHSPKLIIHSSRNYGVLQTTGPKKADDTYADRGVWSFVDDPATAPPDGSAQLALEPMDDSFLLDADGVTQVLDAAGNPIPVYKIKVLTPLDEAVVAALPGRKAGGTVTWKSAGMADVDAVIEYSDPALGHTVLTGSELPETP